MNHRDRFTLSEWKQLQRTIESATNAVIVAAPGGLLQEVFAEYRGWTEASELYAGNPFIQDLLKVSPDELRELNASEDPDLERSDTEIIENALQDCRNAVELLRGKCSSDEIETYRRVILFLAEKVARAASEEGGFFGIGGKKVSTTEADVLHRLAEALGISDYTPATT